MHAFMMHQADPYDDYKIASRLERVIDERGLEMNNSAAAASTSTATAAQGGGGDDGHDKVRGKIFSSVPL